MEAKGKENNRNGKGIKRSVSERKPAKRLMLLMPLLMLGVLCSSCGEEGLEIRTFTTEEDTGAVQQVSSYDGEDEVPTEGAGTEEAKAEENQTKDTRAEEYKNGETGTIVVHVCGAVEKEGVYTLPEKSRIFDAVNAAGGFTKEAAGHAVNLAGPISDGEQIYIPTEAETETGIFSEGTGSAGERETGADTRVNINTAGKEELTTLKGIGPGRAEDIISYRDANGRFEKPEDLIKVPGIKEGTYNKLKDQIRVD